MKKLILLLVLFNTEAGIFNKSKDALKAKVELLHKKIAELTKEQKQIVQKWQKYSKENMESLQSFMKKVQDKNYEMLEKENALKLKPYSKEYAELLEKKVKYLTVDNQYSKEVFAKVSQSAKEQVALMKNALKAFDSIKF